MVKRVALIIERTDVALGGAERSITELTEALSALGLEVHLLAGKGTSDSGNIHALCQNAPGKRVTLAAFDAALRRHLAQTRYDVVHSVLPFEFADLYQPRGGAYAEAAIRNAVSYSNPLIRSWKRATAGLNSRRRELLRAERRLCRGSDGPVVAALSHYVADQFQRHYGTLPRRIVLTLNGVSTDPPADSDAAGRFRSQFVAHFHNRGIEKPVVCLFAAHNFRLKGLGALIRAMQIVSGTPTERAVGLVVAGAGRNNVYQTLARRLGVEKHILFLGAVGHVRNALAASDVAILPTYYDPSSRFILEGLAAGKPVITTRFNGATDHFTDGRHGKVIDSPGDAGALADAIRHFTSAANIEKAARAIREDDLASKVSIRRVARETLELYQSLFDTRRRCDQGSR